LPSGPRGPDEKGLSDADAQLIATLNQLEPDWPSLSLFRITALIKKSGETGDLGTGTESGGSAGDGSAAEPVEKRAKRVKKFVLDAVKAGGPAKLPTTKAS
jgi:hypothetical protein